MQIPTIEDIRKAHKVVSVHAHLTPVMSSQNLDAQLQCRLHFKCENFQRVGAFKFRGATNAVQSLSQRDVARGVATHSSGNHAQALALAARIRGVKAYIVMPESAPQVKIDAVVGYGGLITFCEPTQAGREAALKKVVEETGATFIHPYNNPRIIAGQGTAALELFEQAPALDIILAPVGGGGLLSGTAITSRACSPSTRVMAGEPAGADDAFRSIRDNKIHPSTNPQTIADGLLTGLGDLTFAIIRDHVDQILTVQEATIVRAMRLIWERMKIIVEPSGAVPLAAVMENPALFADKKIGIIVSGGNVDLQQLPWIKTS